MLTEAQVLEMLALMTEPPEEPAPEESIEEEVVDEIVEEEPIIEEPIVEGEPTEEEVTTEENQEGGIIEEINEIIDEVIDEIVEEIMPDEEIGEEVIEETEAPVIDETQVIEEAPTDETSTVEEQAVTLPEESISNQDGAGENNSEGNIEVINNDSVTIDSGGDGRVIGGVVEIL